uniref:DUF2975 domain-containing protein n=1 Tax=Candidatus Berkiella cookevillensis TaxID=437022 RepID=A0A0Q9YKL9_9GAMM
MEKIQALSKRLRFIVQMMYYLIPIMNVLYWLAISEETINQLTISSVPFDHVMLTPVSRTLGFLVTSIPISLLMFIFYQFACIFKNYSHGAVFCIENAKRYKRVGLGLLVLAVTYFITDILMSIVLSGKTVVTVGIGASQLYPIIFGAAIYIISFIMEKAHQMDEDHKYTI